ncbi:hypothetical protein [Amycolatopsis orientalis]|nr:hypothetical protein [Amycolatopsis orientalis]
MTNGTLAGALTGRRPAGVANACYPLPGRAKRGFPDRVRGVVTQLR